MSGRGPESARDSVSNWALPTVGPLTAGPAWPRRRFGRAARSGDGTGSPRCREPLGLEEEFAESRVSEVGGVRAEDDLGIARQLYFMRRGNR